MDSILNIVIPRILKDISKHFKIIVSGGRAISQYVNFNSKNDDWDIIVIGSQKTQELVCEEIINKLEELDYNTILNNYKGDGSDFDFYSLKSRDWWKINIIKDGNNIHVIDIYIAPEGIKYNVIEKDGIKYADLGFLLRELEEGLGRIPKLLQKAANIKGQDLSELIDTVEYRLENNLLDISNLEEYLEEIKENGSIEELTKIQPYLEDVKKTFLNLTKEKEELWGYILSNKVSTNILYRVCDVCREVESQYDKLKGLTNNCKIIKTMCNDLGYRRIDESQLRKMIGYSEYKEQDDKLEKIDIKKKIKRDTKLEIDDFKKKFDIETPKDIGYQRMTGEQISKLLSKK